MQDFEKHRRLYSRKNTIFLRSKAPAGTPLLYESKDLVTHAVCVGMTGSGKTGLCIGLLEEAAIDGIPAIAIDPKGDIAEPFLLTFPELQPTDFRPWINEDEARTKGLSADEFAAKQAELWTKGLASFGEMARASRGLKTPWTLSSIRPAAKRAFPSPF